MTYDHLKALLKQSKPFPTFSEVRNDLQLEETYHGSAVFTTIDFSPRHTKETCCCFYSVGCWLVRFCRW